MGSSLVFLNTMDTGVHGGCNAYTLFQVNINPSTCLISKVSTHNDLINRGLLSYVEANAAWSLWQSAVKRRRGTVEGNISICQLQGGWASSTASCVDLCS